MNENQDENRVGILTSPVPVEGEHARSGQNRISSEERPGRERIADRQAGLLPEVAL